MTPKKLNYKMSIPPEFRDQWSFFGSRAKIEGITTTELLQDIIDEYLEGYKDERAQAEEELDDLAPLRDKVPKKVKIKKPVKPKKKSFISKKVSITKKKDDSSDEDDVMTIQDTAKFKLLYLVRSLDSGSGVDPEKLREVANEKGILNPRLQLNKMIRRGILYIHLGRIHLS
ncbi:MAG: hypothetical protein CXT75_01755 [Methanobacteriota archaeon]|nr:MAG: hypothetical protein CXT75_01755 [Euryarchaeota archaeon]